MSKSITKRIRITRNKKIVRRPMGVSHFRTRQTSRALQSRRGTRSLNFPLKTLLNY